MSIEDPLPSPDRTSRSPHSSQPHSPRLSGFSGFRSRMTGSTDELRHQRSLVDRAVGNLSDDGSQGARKFIEKLNHKIRRKRTNRNAKIESPK